jgi:hypothetical protein
MCFSAVFRRIKNKLSDLKYALSVRLDFSLKLGKKMDNVRLFEYKKRHPNGCLLLFQIGTRLAESRKLSAASITGWDCL